MPTPRPSPRERVGQSPPEPASVMPRGGHAARAYGHDRIGPFATHFHSYEVASAPLYCAGPRFNPASTAPGNFRRIHDDYPARRRVALPRCAPDRRSETVPRAPGSPTSSWQANGRPGEPCAVRGRARHRVRRRHDQQRNVTPANGTPSPRRDPPRRASTLLRRTVRRAMVHLRTRWIRTELHWRPAPGYFPTAQNQIAFVATGRGAMPGFATALTPSRSLTWSPTSAKFCPLTRHDDDSDEVDSREGRADPQPVRQHDAPGPWRDAASLGCRRLHECAPRPRGCLGVGGVGEDGRSGRGDPRRPGPIRSCPRCW